MNLLPSKEKPLFSNFRTEKPTITTILATQINSNSCSSSSDSEDESNSGPVSRNMYVRCPLPNIKLYGDHSLHRFQEEEKSRALNPNYKTSFQTDIEDQDRNLIVSGIFSICNQLNVSDGAIFLSVKMFDYVLSKIEIPREKLKSYAYCCILLATKSEDIFQNQIIERICQFGEDIQESVLIELEFKIFKTINYNVIFSTVFIFLTHYLSNSNISTQESLDIMYNISRFFAFSAISTDDCTFHYDSETIAIACLSLGSLVAKRPYTFTENLESFHNLNECGRTIFEYAKYIMENSPVHAIYYLAIKSLLDPFFKSHTKESIYIVPNMNPKTSE